MSDKRPYQGSHYQLPGYISAGPAGSSESSGDHSSGSGSSGRPSYKGSSSYNEGYSYRGRGRGRGSFRGRGSSDYYSRGGYSGSYSGSSYGGGGGGGGSNYPPYYSSRGGRGRGHSTSIPAYGSSDYSSYPGGRDVYRTSDRYSTEGSAEAKDHDQPPSESSNYRGGSYRGSLNYRGGSYKGRGSYGYNGGNPHYDYSSHEESTIPFDKSRSSLYTKKESYDSNSHPHTSTTNKSSSVSKPSVFKSKSYDQSKLPSYLSKNFNNPWISILRIKDDKTQSKLESNFVEENKINKKLTSLQFEKHNLLKQFNDLNDDIERDSLHVSITNEKLEEFIYL